MLKTLFDGVLAVAIMVTLAMIPVVSAKLIVKIDKIF